jgi:hypothetical protein
VVLTRSPLGLHQCCHRLDLVRLACIRHAASVRPEPGSNSPSRPLGKRASREIREPIGLDSASDWRRFDRSQSATVFLDSRHDEADPIEPPALAFGSRSSVFKERPGTRLSVEVPGSLRARPTRGSDTPVPVAGASPQQRKRDPSSTPWVRQRNPCTMSANKATVARGCSGVTSDRPQGTRGGWGRG